MPTVDGLASGIQSTQIINQVMNVARGPIRVMETELSTLRTRRDNFQTLNTKLTALQTAVQAMDTPAELAAFTSSSSQASAVTATTVAGATVGSHSVEVLSVARETVLNSGGFAAGTDVLQDGTLDITVAGTLTSVAINALSNTNTVQSLATYINDNIAGAQAYVLDTGSATNPFQLVVRGASTGLANAVSTSVTQTGGTGALIALTESRPAADAQVVVDSITVFSADNTITAAIPGVNLNLLGTTTGAATVTINNDTTAMSGAMQGVVDAYNDLRTFIDAQSVVSGTDTGGLGGDSTLRTVERRMQNVFASGFSSGSLSSLTSLGVEGQRDGKLVFDSAAFTTAVNNNYADLETMLTGPTGLFTGLTQQLDILANPLTGMVQDRIGSLDTRETGLLDSIADSERLLTIEEETLRAQFTAMEIAMSQYQATGDYLTQQFAAMSNSNRK